MKKFVVAIFFVCIVVVLLSSCEVKVKLDDGVYRVEMSEYDENGYKDFVEFSIVDGIVTEITADAVYEKDGSLKTSSQEIKSSMEKLSGTYPEKFYSDLVNKYIGSLGEDTDVIAGATMSSKNFFKMMDFAKNAAINADSSIKVVEID